MKYPAAMTLAWFFSCSLFAQADRQRDSLVLKNGSAIESSVKSLSPWAFTFEDGFVIPFRDVSTLITSDSLLVGQLREWYPALLVSADSTGFLVSFGNLRLLSVSEGSPR